MLAKNEKINKLFAFFEVLFCIKHRIKRLKRLKTRKNEQRRAVSPFADRATCRKYVLRVRNLNEAIRNFVDERFLPSGATMAPSISVPGEAIYLSVYPYYYRRSKKCESIRFFAFVRRRWQSGRPFFAVPEYAGAKECVQRTRK